MVVHTFNPRNLEAGVFIRLRLAWPKKKGSKKKVKKGRRTRVRAKEKGREEGRTEPPLLAFVISTLLVSFPIHTNSLYFLVKMTV